MFLHQLDNTLGFLDGLFGAGHNDRIVSCRDIYAAAGANHSQMLVGGTKKLKPLARK
jgi:hypothetical protein